MTQVDTLFAKVLRFGQTRVDVGENLYNLFNTNDSAGYEQTYDYRTQCASWLQPTSIVPPRFERVNVNAEFLTSVPLETLLAEIAVAIVVPGERV